MEEISLNWSMGVMLRNSRLYLWWKVREKTVISSRWVSSMKQCPLLGIIGSFLAVNGKHVYDMLPLDFALQEALGQTGDSACLWMTHPHCNVPVYFYFSDLYFSLLFFRGFLYMPLIYLWLSVDQTKQQCVVNRRFRCQPQSLCSVTLHSSMIKVPLPTTWV